MAEAAVVRDLIQVSTDDLLETKLAEIYAARKRGRRAPPELGGPLPDWAGGSRAMYMALRNAPPAIRERAIAAHKNAQDVLLERLLMEARLRWRNTLHIKKSAGLSDAIPVARKAIATHYGLKHSVLFSRAPSGRKAQSQPNVLMAHDALRWTLQEFLGFSQVAVAKALGITPRAVRASIENHYDRFADPTTWKANL